MDALILGLRVFVALGAVLGLMWFLQRRLGKGTGRRRADRALTIVSRQSVGQKASVVVVDASGLLSDPDTAVFELSDGVNAAAWFAVRLREHSAGPDRASDAFAGGDAVAGRLGRINNIEMALTVEIGRTRMSVRDVLSLEPGTVIELDRSAGAPADVLLNGRLIAHGEVVVLDQDYAVRITRILDVAEGLS